MDDHMAQLEFNWKKLQELYKEVQQLEKPPDRYTQLQEAEKETMEQLKKLTEKADKDFRAEKAKEEQALNEKNGEFAQVYAENAIPMKKEWLIRIDMEGQVYAVFHKMKISVMDNELTRCFQEYITNCEPVVLSVKGLQEVSAEIDKFKQLVQVMEDSKSSATHQERVDRFIQEIAEEIEHEENCNQQSQQPNIPSTVEENPKDIGQDQL